MSEPVQRNLLNAIATIRAACDDAERYAKNGDAYAIQRVFHCLAWGQANASSSIENAMSRLMDENARELFAAQENATP